MRLVSYSSELVNINAFWNSNALDGSTIDLMTIVVKAATVNAITTLPASPASFTPFQETQAVRTRTFELDMGFFADHENKWWKYGYESDRSDRSSGRY